MIITLIIIIMIIIIIIITTTLIIIITPLTLVIITLIILIILIIITYLYSALHQDIKALKHVTQKLCAVTSARNTVVANSYRVRNSFVLACFSTRSKSITSQS